MNLNPVQYFLKRYHSPELKPKELKRMLNLWFPFLVNRISIISISDDFCHMQVCLKHSFWNRNPNKSIWGGSIASAMDPFFPTSGISFGIDFQLKNNINLDIGNKTLLPDDDTSIFNPTPLNMTRAKLKIGF
mgnify:CR=1 FL=1